MNFEQVLKQWCLNPEKKFNHLKEYFWIKIHTKLPLLAEVGFIWSSYFEYNIVLYTTKFVFYRFVNKKERINDDLKLRMILTCWYWLSQISAMYAEIFVWNVATWSNQPMEREFSHLVFWFPNLHYQIIDRQMN